MADVLSQQEIDALLNALDSGELQASDVTEEKKKVKVYDFKHAMRYSKEQLRSITRIHENFTRLLASDLSTQLRTFVQIEIDLVEQVNYHEFIASIPSRTILNVFEVQPMDGKMVMEINPQVAYAVLERMLGGQGDPAERSGALTEIESVLLQKVFAKSFDMYHEVWKSVLHIDVKWEGIEANPQFLQIASPNETVIVIAFRTVIGETTGRMTLCLPHLIVEPMLPNLTTHQWLSTMSKTNVSQHDKIMQNLDIVPIPIIAELGRAKLPVSDVLNLQIGDVIGIDAGKLQIKVDQLTRFLANPGLLNGHYAVQIDQVIDSEGDEE
ncbi:flagellar motor switch protein FliM [Neobacillus sp. MM2021_6]|uniref:flagellar motor switch protein FliM n=1 Tax=Bacillaceae TaxID=186817 RepID=UPI00140C4C33|nr:MULTISPECIES: flagellar motor switch protein FliM [Bacillaceae]MBO0961804.1 flagellar motor switch protein FliM [Neobacillus sp. MM2021_6]NHC21089.1 flagellar motor switch protein FliM [Bacillus sp. MM2020_4]